MQQVSINFLFHLFILTCYITSGVVQSCCSKLVPAIVTTSLNAGIIKYISAGGGSVYISDSKINSTVYRYTRSDLQLQADSVILSQGNIIGLAATPDGQWLVTCLDNDECVICNGSDLTIISSMDDAVGVFSTNPIITVFTDSTAVPDGQSFYVGSYGITSDDNTNSIRLGQYGFFDSSINQRSDFGVPNTAVLEHRKYFSGFTYSSYAYFIVVDRGTTSKRELRIVRVCHNDTTSHYPIQSQYELQLQCGSGVLVGTTVVRGVSVFDKDKLVIGLNNGGTDNRLCMFNITMINSLMDDTYTNCTVLSIGVKNIPWISNYEQSCSDDDSFSVNPQPCIFASDDNDPVGIAPTDPLSSSIILNNNSVLAGLRASIALTLDNIDLIFVGYLINNSYYLNKYHWINGSLSLLDEVPIPLTGDISTSEQTIIVSEDIQTLFLTTLHEVVSVSVENCSSASSCVECVSLGDPLCGWCVFENKCSRSSLCMNSESTGRYLLQGKDNSCLERVDITPISPFIKDIESMPYQLSVTFVPPSLSDAMLPDEEFYCVFNITGTNQLPVMSSLYNGMCSLADIVKQVLEISLDTEFSIMSSVTNMSFFNSETPYSFYDCASQQTCSGCVIVSVCGWCQLDFKCTGDNETCTEGVSNWLTMSLSGSPTDVCPFLVASNGVDDYTQPTTVSDNLSLMTLNTPGISGLVYHCVFNGSIITAAIYNKNTEIECQINYGQLTSTMDTDTIDFVLRQVYNGQYYSLETNGSLDINVTLYDCPLLAESCSQCLGQNIINTGFNCGWCSNANQCNVASQCGNGERVNISGGCGQPIINGISPSTGSPRGQTTITIDGTDLGVEFSDIISVRVGSRTCKSIESQYSTGVRIVCTISSGGINLLGTAIVSVTINTSGEGQRIAISDQLTILEPVIESVRPNIGPVNGGTITIRGVNLDVGNKENTRVLFREIAQNKGLKSCPERECIIVDDSLFNSTCLSCVYSVNKDGSSANCIMAIILNISGDYYFNNAVRFQYNPDPVFTSVTPQDIIPIGGIAVVFSGTNLNVITSPILRITDSRFLSTEQSCRPLSDDKLQCLIPMLTPFSSYFDSTIYHTDLVYTISSANDTSSELNYTSHQHQQQLLSGIQLIIRPNPDVTGVINNNYTLFSDQVLRINGRNLMDTFKSYINITIGHDYQCIVINIGTTEISCVPSNVTFDMQLFLKVRIGNYLAFGEESNQWKVSFITVLPESNSASTSSHKLTSIVIGSVFSFIILILLVSAVIVLIVVKYHCKIKLPRNNAKYDNIRVWSYLRRNKTNEDKPRSSVVETSVNVVYSSYQHHSTTLNVITEDNNTSVNNHIYEEIKNEAVHRMP